MVGGGRADVASLSASLAAAALATTWWAPDPSTAAAWRAALDTVWPANAVEIRVGPPDDALDDLWYDGEALVFAHGGLVERRISPDDPWTLAALVRSWLRETQVRAPLIRPAEPAAPPAPTPPAPTPIRPWAELGLGPGARLPGRDPSVAIRGSGGAQREILRLGGALEAELSEGEADLARVGRGSGGALAALELPASPAVVAIIQAELGLSLVGLRATTDEQGWLLRPRSAVSLLAIRQGASPAQPYGALRVVVEPERDLAGESYALEGVEPALARVGVEAGVHLGRRP